VLHTFTVMPPYAPGGQDTWDNLWLQRSAAHPWCGMRNMAAMIGSGVMDRYPSLRVGTLEARHGWLPFWMARLDEHAETIKAALPELDHKPSEYVTGRLMIAVLGGLTAVERDLIRTRTPRPCQTARAAYGRPSRLTDAQKAEARRRRAKGAPLNELARSYDVSRSTISRLTD
jgi:hypothetical protein